MVLGALCLPGTLSKARLWIVYFPSIQRNANYKILYLNTRNSFMKPSQVSDLKAFKNILATAVLLYTLSIFRGLMFVLLEGKN